MKNRLSRHISKYVEVTEELEHALAQISFIREIPKGTVLLKEGEVSNECFFILEGLIRSYCIRDAEEVTVDFFMEDQVVCLSCYGKNTPSELCLETLEDTVACVGTPQIEEEMFQKYPQLETMSRIIGEKIMSGYKNQFDNFKLASPEQRYLNLVEKNPGLIQRVPQYQLAGYLGIKPESLSRIRKRISKNR